MWERSRGLRSSSFIPVISYIQPHLSHKISLSVLLSVNLNTEAELFIPVQQEQGGVGHDDDHEGEHCGDDDRDDEADLGAAHGRHFEFRARIRSRPPKPHILPSNRLDRTHPVIPAVFWHFFLPPPA